MNVFLSLSKKQSADGRKEVFLSLSPKVNGKRMCLRAKSGILVEEKYYDAEKKSLKVISERGAETPSRKEYRFQYAKINTLCDHILMEFRESDSTQIASDWLSVVVDKYLYPEKWKKQFEKASKSFLDIANEFLAMKVANGEIGELRVRTYNVTMRIVCRFEKYKQMHKRGFSFDVDKVTKDDMEELRNYIREEASLAQKYPDLFKKLHSMYPANLKKGRDTIEERGNNSVVTKFKHLKAIFRWCNEQGITDNDPFKGFIINSERYGTPFYLSLAEREQVAQAEMPTLHLQTQRDIFIFQCYVGCRVSDLEKLTEHNIVDGILVYTPRKTKDEKDGVQARVPLKQEALALIEKYRGVDKHNRLFPFISPQQYNYAIKDILSVAKIDRMVEVRNSLSGEIELKPICEVASSHMARRTFVGNLYTKVQDPNLIGKMSGHTEGSRAFSRYRNIEDETLKQAIDLI